MRHITLIVAVVALAFAAPAFSGKGGNGGGNGGGGGNGNGNVTTSSGSCTFDGGVVTGTGLPTWTLLNFMITDGSGTTGWVLGQSDSGTWSVAVPDGNGPATYEFASRTWGADGSKYDVFASCSS